MTSAPSTPLESTAQNAMHTRYANADGFLTVAEGITMMRQHQTSVLIINRRHESDEIGIVLASDIAKKVLGANRPAERVNLYEIMSKPVVSVHPGMKVRYCARLFDQFGLSLAPVVDANRQVIGVVDYFQLVTVEQ